MALRNLLVRIGADLSGLQKGMNKAQKQVNNFSRNINNSLKLVSAAFAAVGATMGIGAAVKDAMEYETAMNQVNRIMGKSADEFKKWAESTGAAFGYSRLEAAKAGATYGNLLSGFSQGADDTRKKTEDLMKATAVVSAATGRTMTDTFERIRSGLLGNTEAIEDLGINVNIAMIESTNAFKQFANGDSWDKLSFQVQQQIRYAAILEQAYTKYGDTIADSTSTRLSTFVQALNNVKLALGQAFLPILNVVLPILSALANRLAVVMGYVAQFVRALVGKKGDIPSQTKALNSQSAAVSGLGDATEKAGKQAKKAGKDAKRGVAGFDEINQLADPSSGGDAGGAAGGGGVTGGAIDMPVPNTEQSEGALDKISNKIKEFADKVKKWLAPLGDSWGRLKQSIVDLWNSPAIVKFRAWIAGGWDSGIEGIVLIIAGALDILAGAIDIVNSILNGDWKKAWDGVGNILLGFWKIITGVIGPLFPGLTAKMKDFGDKFKKKWDELANINFAEMFLKLIKWFADLKDKASAKWNEIKTITSKVWDNMKSIIQTKANDAWNNFKAPFEGAYSWFKTNVIDKISYAFSSIKEAFSGSITTGFKKVYNTAVSWINGMIGDINKIKIKGIWDGANIPKIPALAKGGITNGPTLALIGDNPGGQEVVSPLDKLQDMMAGAVGTAVMQAMQHGRPSTSNGDILLNIDGRTFARIVKPFIEAENQRVGNNVKLNSI
jgi:hypothetical protein